MIGFFILMITREWENKTNFLAAMKKQIKYISETGRSFDTPKEAFEEDQRLLKVIKVYKDDLDKMEGGDKMFGSGPVTPELIQQWREAIVRYEKQLHEARSSWAEFGFSLEEKDL